MANRENRSRKGKYLMKLFKWFFDGTSAEEHDSSAEVETEEVEVESTEEEVDEYSIEEDFSEFDVKSPFLFNKVLDEPEQEVEESSEEAEEESEETSGETEDKTPEVPEQTGPYRTKVSWSGNSYTVRRRVYAFGKSGT